MTVFVDDAAARRLAVREFAQPVVIEAGAGTGKTRTLVARIGTWLLGAGWEQARRELSEERQARGEKAPADSEIAMRAAEGLVAITFTEAAAAEMAARVDRLLAQVAAGEPARDLDEPPPGIDPVELATRSRELLASSSRLRLSTIHGFCHRLLAEAPLEAGLHPGFEVDPEGERTVELATAVLLGRLRGGAPELVELLAAGVDPPELLEALVALATAGVRPDDLAGDPFSAGLVRARFDALAGALDRLFAAAAPLRAGRRVASIDDGLEALARLRREVGDVDPSAEGIVALAGALEAAAEEAWKILGEWAAGRLGKTEAKALGGGAAALVAAAAEAARAHAALHELDPQRLRLARRALQAPLAELLARRHTEGIVSFDDLLERAARLLAEREGVRARLRRAMRQLLVDEFQDTDGRQCDLLRALVLAPAEAPAPGLFLVGDPKQSIYGWRSADLAAYSAFLDDVAAVGGRFGRLEVNFRSQPPILAEVERIAGPVLVEERGVQAGFQPLRPSPENAGGSGFTAAGRAAVEYWAAWDGAALAAGESTDAVRATEIEAAAIARDVRGLVEGGHAGWGDFAVLLRARGDLDVYLDAFRRAGVPYVVQKDRSYYRRREVLDAAAAVRALLDPADLLAAVAFLRSPFVGVPDFAWLPLWRSGFPEALAEVDGERGLAAALLAVERAAAEDVSGLPASARAPGWRESLVAAVEAIAALRADYRRLPATEWVERLRARLLVEPIAAARFLGRFGLANLERLLTDLEAALAVEPDPGRALAALRRAIAEERPAEEARPPEERADSVAVLTIHTAKGLEFPHVYLVQAQRRPGGPAAGALPFVAVGPPGERREMVLFGAPTPGWREIADGRRRVAAAEAARLLYVATTRAIARLVICGRWDGESDPAASSGVPSFAELLGPRLAGAPELALASPARHDEHGVLWRLADDGAAADTEPAGNAAVVAANRQAASTDLAGLRAAARRRSSRPRIVAAAALREEPAETAAVGDAAAARASARAAGSALHRALELSPLAAADAEGWTSHVEAAFLARHPSATPAERESFSRALAALRSSHLWRSLERLQEADGVLARELPLLVAARPDPQGEGPTDGHVGTLDLLYRDAATGELVVADFKSDAVTDDTEIAGKLALYRPQLELYGRAVRAALELDAPPRLELWLLAADRIVELPAGDSG